MLKLRHITKRFAGTIAVEAIDLSVAPGEIRALLGENGAGKSTLVKIAAGVTAPDHGAVLVDGEVLAPGVNAAQAAGVHLIHQEPACFPDLEVAENMLLRTAPRRSWPPGIDWARTRALARTQLERLGTTIDPRTRGGDLSVADQQMIDIAAALLGDPRVLIVDEPTAVLTPVEVARLFDLLRRLRDDGVAIVFIGHRLEEVFALADSITVLRDGRRIVDLETGATTPDAVIAAMVGRDYHAVERTRDRRRAEPRLVVSGVSSPGTVSDVSLTVHAGEIVGLAGLVGAGRTELAEAIFGVRERSGGQVRAGAGLVSVRSPRDAMRAGVAYLPEDRGQHGLALALSVSDNISLTVLRSIARTGWLRGRAERRLAAETAGRLSIKARDVSQPAAELSGGNQQKVALGKWLAMQPNVLIADEPTRGVDVGAKADIHALLEELADAGLGVLLISSELPELLALADRVLVMREGRLAGALARADATPEAVMRLATGHADVIAAGMA